MNSAPVLHLPPVTRGDTGDRARDTVPPPAPGNGSRLRRTARATGAALAALVSAGDDPACGVRVGLRHLDDPRRPRPRPAVGGRAGTGTAAAVPEQRAAGYRECA